MACRYCNKKLGILRSIFHNECKECEETEFKKFSKQQKKEERKEIAESKKINKAKESLKKFETMDGANLDYGNLFYNCDFVDSGTEKDEIFSTDIGYSGISHNKDKKNKYSTDIKEVIERIVKNNFDAEKTLSEIEDEIEHKIHLDKLKEKERKRKIREDAEKDFYGRVKSKRENISLDKQEDILRRFNNKCIICDKDEGLHIHHKDNNPQNNNIENLIVLCGVCHKKTHMKVR